MLSMNSSSGLLLLALVLYEVQNVVKAIFFAIDWPDDVLIESSKDGLWRKAVKAPLSVRSRIRMAWYRTAYCSAFLHGLHSRRMKQAPAFKVGPSVMFGAIVGSMGALLGGMSGSDAGSLAVISSAVIFVSSQTRSVLEFHALRTVSDELLEELIKGRTS